MPSDLREPGGAGRAEGAPGRPAPAVLGTQNKGRAFTQIKMEGKWEKLIAWLVAQHLVQRQLLMACWDAALEQWIFKSVASTGVRTDLPLENSSFHNSPEQRYPLITSCIVRAG